MRSARLASVLASTLALIGVAGAAPGLPAGTVATDPLKWTAPSGMTVEATSPAGAVVTYNVTATKETGSGSGKVERPLDVTCTPPSGLVFPLGPHTVLCTVEAGEDADERRTFDVKVVDTTAPTVLPPASISVTSPDGSPLPATHPTLAAFLAGFSATDLADSILTLANDAPPAFPLGTTTVRFVAADDAGNHATASASVTVIAPQPPPPVTPPPPPPADALAPGPVTAARAATGSGIVRLVWRAPSDTDFLRVEITRARAGASPAVVYRGAASRWSDTAVRNGVTYAYAIRAYDAAGNGSEPVRVSARPRLSRLIAPLHGDVLIGPPVLRWRASNGATYYNVQLWRGGRKVLSRWPARASLALPQRWSFGGRRHALVSGIYTWYVWPGFGPRAAARYGNLLGSRTFEVLGR